VPRRSEIFAVGAGGDTVDALGGFAGPEHPRRRR
jgi:hypothetical protein